MIDKNAIGSHLSSQNCINELPIATSDASVQRLKEAPGMGCFRRVASAKAFLAYLPNSVTFFFLGGRENGSTDCERFPSGKSLTQMDKCSLLVRHNEGGGECIHRKRPLPN
ncbi:hypothetical protein NPIL_329761 [Nephila pilipes]|uniref:Uncharacterized protein n=1 Tax=Nephila pilipes TaxID=299642 RepID=A0A8X6PJT7_NEPPI|nr:hypothetical protein NPIL_329761 [Nephila pilipes]